MLAEVSDMQLQLEDLCEEDAAKIRRAAAERGMAPREFFRLLKERQADTVAKAAADRLARQLDAGDDPEDYDMIRTRPPMSSLFVVARSNR
jgi:hypothetical protein